MKRIVALAVLVSTGGLLGCFETTYRIAMEPTDGTLRRRLEVQRVSTGEQGGPVELEADELALLNRLYGDGQMDADTKTYRFTGEFAGRLPADVGGTGLNYYARTSMGSVRGYVEQFRGAADLAAQVDQRLRAADRTVDILLGWMGGQLGDRPYWPKLKTALDESSRGDLKEVSLHVWRYGWSDPMQGSRPAEPGEDGADRETNLYMRVCLHLFERGYLRPADVTAARHWSESDLLRDAAIRHALAYKAGLDAAAAEQVLALIREPDSASLKDYLRKTPEYDKLLVEHRQAEAAATQPTTQADEPDPMAVLYDYVDQLVGSSSIDQDTVHVTLSAPAEPMLTNGQWDADATAVRWEANVEPRAGRRFHAPALAYAFWAESDAAFQQSRFGRVVLTGHELSRYCLWREALPADQVAAWEAYLATLVPGESLAAKLDSPPAEVAEAGEVCSRIKDALFATATATAPASPE